MIEQLLTLHEVAERLAVAPKTIRNWQSGNQIPYLKINGAVRFSPKQLAEWLANCEMGPEAPRR